MKSTIVICVLFFAGLALARPGGDHYTDQYDHVDFKEILSNPRLYDAYRKCMLGVGICTPEGKELKSKTQDALENECAKCTEKQKEGINYVLKYLINHKENDWKELAAKYDPDSKYRTKYEDKLREIKA